jgi:aspartyl-tRNA(Asn)/glutamyl-tRNA(Gln) amidotransferase subunit B
MLNRRYMKSNQQQHAVANNLADIDYKMKIGMEAHCQLNAKSKLFCSCKIPEFDSLPNTCICPVCCGEPGALPSFYNSNDILLSAIKTCLALNCTISNNLQFDRKHYFFPDTPKNYQITQYYNPIGRDGHIILPNGKTINISRIQIEEDSARILYKVTCYPIYYYNTNGQSC